MINVLSYGMKCSIPLLFVLAIYTSILICFYMLFSLYAGGRPNAENPYLLESRSLRRGRPTLRAIKRNNLFLRDGYPLMSCINDIISMLLF